MGRTIKIKGKGNACKVSYDELCNKALGAADYYAITKRFNTIFLYGVKSMNTNTHN